MRIVEIVPQLASGGGERFVVDLCNEFVEMGHAVRLIVTHSLNRPGLAFYLSEVDKRVEVISMNKRMGVDLSLPFKLRRSIREFCPDVVHTHLQAIVYAGLEALHAKCRVVHCHTVHNAADKEAGAAVISRIVRRWLFKGRRFMPITISEESRRSFRDFYHMDAPMIYNGRDIPENIQSIDLSEYKKSSSTRIIINIARILEVKRQDLIARVCRRLELDGYDFAMLVIGRKADPKIVSGVEAAGCSYVHMLGERSNPLEYLAAADGYCLMSSFEGMPISLIEAMGCGAVLVCTPVGGIKNVVNDGRNGFLAADLSEEACYKALRRFLDTPYERLAEMKSSARESYSPFSMHKCAAKYIELFNNRMKC